MTDQDNSPLGNMAGKPAFPSEKTTTEPLPFSTGNHTSTEHNNGMTMRQWYKGMALQGLLINDSGASTLEGTAIWVGKIANAMIKEDEEHAL